jgi:hypothetical protein
MPKNDQKLLVEFQLFSFELAPIYYFDCAILTLKYLNEQHTYDGSTTNAITII